MIVDWYINRKFKVQIIVPYTPSNVETFKDFALIYADESISSAVVF
jgi:hypothetical protein